MSIYYRWVRIFYTGENFVRTCQKFPFDFIGFSDLPTVQMVKTIPKRTEDTPQTLWRKNLPPPSDERLHR